jgi:hypothetical protein
LSVGPLATGGAALGWNAMGGIAAGWNAVGGFAIAQHGMGEKVIAPRCGEVARRNAACLATHVGGVMADQHGLRFCGCRSCCRCCSCLGGHGGSWKSVKARIKRRQAGVSARVFWLFPALALLCGVLWWMLIRWTTSGMADAARFIIPTVIGGLGCLLFVLSLPLWLRLVPMNSFYGVRLPSTFPLISAGMT